MRLKLHFPSSPVISRTGQSGHPPIAIDTANFLKAQLNRQPEIRPEVVERARALARDPSYPPMDVLWQVAGMILASPDLSEDGS